MRAGIITGQGAFELVDAPDPELQPGAAIVDIALCGICGSDVHAFQFGGPYGPTLRGHEWTGVVSALADDVSSLGLAEGDHVVGGAAPPCGACRQCQRGNHTSCAKALKGLSGTDGFSPASGGFARRQAVDARRLVKVPGALSTVQAALVEPTTVAAHAVRRSAIRLGDVAAVIGAGPIGMLTFQCARAAGAGKVFVVEPNEGRRRLALELGADGAWPPGAELEGALADATDGVGPDIVYDCAGVPATVHAAAKLTRRGGAVCLVGVASERATINPATWVLKELRIDTSAAYGHEDMAIAMGLIADGRVRVAELHHATVGLDQLGDTITEMAAGPSERVKVLVDPHL